MKKQKVFLVTVIEHDGNIRHNPLLPNELHLIKTILSDKDVKKVEVEIKIVTGRTQTDIENKLCLLF